MVNDQRVLSRREQLREFHLAAIDGRLEDVILGKEPARRERPALGRDLFVQPPELVLRLQQLVARAPVFARLTGERDVRVAKRCPPLVHVTWTAVGRHGERRLARAAELSTPARLGYSSWLPDDVSAMIGPAAALRIDDWVLPSHVQADRVAKRSLDLALARVTAQHVKEHGLTAHLLRAEPLSAVLRGVSSTEPVAAAQLTVLVDADESTWWSWNRFAEEFAANSGARIIKIDDGGIIGDAFYAHVRRVRAPVLACPKRPTTVTPPTLGHRPIADPIPLWTWSLLHCSDDARESVRHIVESLLAVARTRHWLTPPAGRWWRPSNDPHYGTLEDAD